ncbi:hypothetical protein CEXT_66281, partial [Caerostris extrusa]
VVIFCAALTAAHASLVGPMGLGAPIMAVGPLSLGLGKGMIAAPVARIAAPSDSSEMVSSVTECSPTESSVTECSPTESSPETECSPTDSLPDTESPELLSLSEPDSSVPQSVSVWVLERPSCK